MDFVAQPPIEQTLDLAQRDARLRDRQLEGALLGAMERQRRAHRIGLVLELAQPVQET